MKKIFLVLFFVFCFLFFVARVNAVTPTPSNQTEIISDLKDRIASRVAQLKLVERKGVIGTVSEASNTQITLIDDKENTKFIDVDELTKFSSPSAKGSFGISDITKGTKIGVLGLYNRQSRRILARFVDVLVLPKTIHGAVSSIDGKNFTITVISEKGDKTIVDVQTITKTMSYTKATGLIRSGFSKVKEGERIIAIGFPDQKEKNLLIASRILIFPELPKNPKITIPNNTSSEDEIIPSTGSGKKLTPITR